MTVCIPMCYIRMFQVFGIQCSLQLLKLIISMLLFQDAFKSCPPHDASGWIVLRGSSFRPLGHLQHVNQMGSPQGEQLLKSYLATDTERLFRYSCCTDCISTAYLHFTLCHYPSLPQPLGLCTGFINQPANKRAGGQSQKRETQYCQYLGNLRSCCIHSIHKNKHILEGNSQSFMSPLNQYHIRPVGSSRVSKEGNALELNCLSIACLFDLILIMQLQITNENIQDLSVSHLPDHIQYTVLCGITSLACNLQ